MFPADQVRSQGRALLALALLAMLGVVAAFTWAVRWGEGQRETDPARIGASAILATEECGRAWAIEQLPRDYRVLQIPTPYEGFLSEEKPCPTGAREIVDLCGRRFLLQPYGRDRARLSRLVPRFPAEVDERCAP